MTEFLDPTVLATSLTAVITLGVTYLLKRYSSLITGGVTLAIVPIISALITVVTAWVTTDISWLDQFLGGVLSIALNQAYRYFTGNGN